jgi:hypothetical protein
MRFLTLLAIFCAAAVCQAETVIVRGPATVVTAHDHAVVLARRGTLVHSGCSQTEGIGCGATPDQARRACCFFGKKQIVDEGVAYSVTARKWFAVIRYR